MTSNATRILSIFLLSSATLLACASSEREDPQESSSSTSTSQSSTTSSTGGEGGAGGQGGSGGQGGTGGTSNATILPTITSTSFYINCQPAIPPDPILGSFTVQYENKSPDKAGSATLLSARLTLEQDKSSMDWSFTSTPSGSINVPPGAPTSLEYQKLSNSGSGTHAPCSYCNGQWTLHAKWDVGGTTVEGADVTKPVECVY